MDKIAKLNQVICWLIAGVWMLIGGGFYIRIDRNRYGLNARREAEYQPYMLPYRGCKRQSFKLQVYILNSAHWILKQCFKSTQHEIECWQKSLKSAAFSVKCGLITAGCASWFSFRLPEFSGARGAGFFPGVAGNPAAQYRVTPQFRRCDRNGDRALRKGLRLHPCNACLSYQDPPHVPI